MAKWVYNRPFDLCDATELRVAKQLAQLGDYWIIRWGFHYHKDREGDFLLLGPTGGALVLEVKGGTLRKLGPTGHWNGPKRDHPLLERGRAKSNARASGDQPSGACNKAV